MPEATKAHKGFARIGAAIILVILIGALLWFAAPMTDTAVSANNRGVLYNNQREYDKAILAFNQAIELDPGFAEAYINRGNAYIELGQYEQAITDFDKATELDPNLQK